MVGALINDGSAPEYTCISAVGWINRSDTPILQVFWTTAENKIVQIEFHDGDWGTTTRTVTTGLRPGTRFATAQLASGTQRRLYMQSSDDSIVELCDDGEGWYNGSVVAAAH